jgi:hypothetical protein
MKDPRRAGLIVAGMFAVTMSISAQQPPTQTPTPAASAHPQSVKVTGCVERATATATPGRPSENDAKFLLTMAQLSTAPTPAQASVAVGQAAPTRNAPVGAPAKVETPMTFRLEGDEPMIEPHVGRKVELSGEIVEAIAPAVATPTPAVGGSPVPTAGTPRPAEAAADGSQVSPRLKVIEIRMLSMTCP